MCITMCDGFERHGDGDGDGDGDDGVEREQEGGGAKKTHQKPTQKPNKS
jgi:hypothetical protein